MPKWKSVVQIKPRIDPTTGRTMEGSMNLGVAVWVPKNDEAKTRKGLVERAVESKLHTIKPGESPVQMKKKLARAVLQSKNMPIPPELE